MLTTHCHGILTFTPNSNANTKPISQVVAFRSIIQAPATVVPSISIANRKWKKRLRWTINGIRKDRDETPSYAQDQECPVPLAQQPLNEYQTLTKSDFFSWALEDFWKYGLRLAGICTAFTTLIGWPVARVSVNPEQELLKCGIGALGGGLLIVTLVALRMYLGWAYVGNRLLSATVEYEETGWYDGEVWVKPPEVLARDRLLGSYTVKPILTRVKSTLIALAISLFGCILLFVSLQSPHVSQPLDLEVDEPQIGYNNSSAELFEPEVCFGGDQGNFPDA